MEKNEQKISISSKCIIESGDEEITRKSLKRYVKEHKIGKGDRMTSVSMVVKVVNGKAVMIGFYA